MQDEMQEKFAHVKLILDTMKIRGLTDADMFRLSGVIPSKFSRIKKGSDLSGSNLFAALKTLDLIKIPDETLRPHLTNNKTLCDDLEFILKNGDNAAISALEYLIKGVKLSVMEGSEQVKLLKEMVSILKEIRGNPEKSLRKNDAGKDSVAAAP